MAEQMQIQIGANVSGAVTGLTIVTNKLGVLSGSANVTGVAINSLQNRVVAFGGGAVTAVAPVVPAFSKMHRSVEAFGGGVKQYVPPAVAYFNRIPVAVGSASTALAKVPGSSNAATQSLINLSRVAQDAPFGFLGIANNLNPLLESFQRLKASTGSTGGALKALKGELTGAGGIGLALGVVSSLAIVFGDKLFSTNRRLSESELSAAKFSAAIKQMADALDELKNKLDLSVEIQTLKLELEGLSGVKLEIGGLQLQKDANLVFIENATKALEALEKKKGVLKGYADAVVKAGDVAKSFGAKETGLSQVLREFRDVSNVPESALGKLTTKELSAFKDYQGVVNAAIDTKKKLEEALGKDVIIGQKIGIKNIAPKADLDKSNSEYKAYVGRIIAEAKKISDAFKDTIDIRLESNFFDNEEQTFEKSLDFLNKFKSKKFSITIDPELKLNAEQLQIQNDLIEREIENVEIFVKGITTLPIPIEPKFSIETGFVKKEIEPKFKDLTKEIGELRPVVVPLKLRLSPEVTDRNKTIEAAKQQAEAFTASFANTLGSGLSDSLSAIGEGLGNILSGKNFGDGLFQAIGGLIQNMGKALIQFGVIDKIVKSILANPLTIGPGVAFAAGIAAIAVGTLIKNLGKSAPGRATGGPVGANMPYQVGERGPEIFIPSTAGRIVSNNNLKSIAGKANQNITVGGEVQISGRNLKLVLARQGSFEGRNV